ncbi:MAG: outer membrane beta-barrel protein, partial [bacterium]|nr:outer membrane beta-barrel protein [bacterium]
TGQVGYAFSNVLLYVKGGAAVVSDKYSHTLNVAIPPGVVGQTFAAASETRWGGVIGAGVEFGFAPNWSVALEYDHLFMGTKDVQLNLIPPFGTAISSSSRISQDVDVGTVRVNYKFGGPVVAKY